VLTIELSLVFPVYIMVIEKWVMSETRKNQIDCTVANDQLDEFSSLVFKIKNYLEKTGFYVFQKRSLGVIIPREIIGIKIVYGKNDEGTR